MVGGGDLRQPGQVPVSGTCTTPHNSDANGRTRADDDPVTSAPDDPRATEREALNEWLAFVEGVSGPVDEAVVAAVGSRLAAARPDRAEAAAAIMEHLPGN